MGLEISQKTALNQYEIINHKTNISLWLHDVVDGLIVPGRVTVENLIAGITLGLDELYANIAHNHDSDYADIAHNHDSDYADIAHNHDSDYADIAHNHDSDYADIAHTHSIYLKSAYAAWTGDGTGAREINLSGESITTPEFIHFYAWNSTNFRLLFWNSAITSGNLFGLNQAGILQLYTVWELDGTTLDIVTDLNTSGWSYRISILGRG